MSESGGTQPVPSTGVPVPGDRAGSADDHPPEREPSYPERVRRAIRERLLQAADAVGIDTGGADVVGDEDDAAAAARAVAALVGRGDSATLWLAWVAVATTYPSRAQLESLLPLGPGTAAALLDAAIPDGAARGDLLAPILLVEDSVIVDVDYAATNDHNSGIQRVVRSASAYWAREPGVVLAAARGSSGALRTLTPGEHARTADWGATGPVPADAVETVLIVPWRSCILFPEVPDPARLDGLAVLAEFSGNRTAAVGHDAIPITGRSWVSRREADKFGRFLPLLRRLDLVIGVSATAAGDFAGISRSMAARGEAHPDVVACPLPVITRSREQQRPPDAAARPLVLVVGSREPRKNQDAVVFAAERLWREGLDFELLLLGSWGWSTLALRRWLRFAAKAGRPVSAPDSASDADLWSAYERAAFTVFPSLQEGFGLPVAESLSRGIPALTSGYGSMAEVAAGGGCLMVDPCDDDALFGAMRRMLVEPELRARLAAEARARPEDSWRRWADDVLGMVRAL